MFTINAFFGCQAWLHSMSKDGRKMLPMHVTLEAGVKITLIFIQLHVSDEFFSVMENNRKDFLSQN